MKKLRVGQAIFVFSAISAAIAITAVAGFSGGSATAQQTLTYNVTIENLTSGQPLTPPVIVAHTDQFDVFSVGQPASEEVRQIAENGNLTPMVTLLNGDAGVIAHTEGSAPVLPGQSATLSIQASAGSLFSWVSMLICTNDGFTGVDAAALPSSGSTNIDTNAYETSTEQNTEDFADIVPPCQSIVGVTSPTNEPGTDQSNPAITTTGDIIAHPGIQGSADLTVADHGWTDPVARVTIAVQAQATGTPSPTSTAAATAAASPTSGPVAPPATGGSPGSGNAAVWPLIAIVAAALIAVSGGTFALVRIRAR